MGLYRLGIIDHYDKENGIALDIFKVEKAIFRYQYINGLIAEAISRT